MGQIQFINEYSPNEEFTLDKRIRLLKARKLKQTEEKIETVLLSSVVVSRTLILAVAIMLRSGLMLTILIMLRVLQRTLTTSRIFRKESIL